MPRSGFSEGRFQAGFMLRFKNCNLLIIRPLLAGFSETVPLYRYEKPKNWPATASKMEDGDD
jgi:hypothetical protein